MWVLTLSVGVLVGCRHGVKDDPILALSANEALLEGKRLLEGEKYGSARRYLSHAFEVEPNSLQGREALLLVADAHYLEGGDSNEISAEAKYRDFMNRFPTSDRAAYVQFQIANALAARMERPDRDQEVTVKALAAYEELLRVYPTSEYAAAARDKIREVRANLAAHELEVARFYLRFGLPKASQIRLTGLLEAYPEYPDRAAALFYLGTAYARQGMADEAAVAFADLRRQYPDSKFVAEIDDVEVLPAPAQSAAASNS
jgi:outer membrane protein assembly factor BamD